MSVCYTGGFGCPRCVLAVALLIALFSTGPGAVTAAEIGATGNGD